MSRLHRHLRLGLLHEGRLVRELLIDRTADVTLGRESGVTLEIPTDPQAPVRQDVLLYDRGWFLVLPDSAAHPDAEVHLRGVTGLPAPVSLRGKRCVPIDAAFGGSVQWGAWTVLFQFVSAGVPVTVTRDQPVLRVGLVLDDRLLTERAFMLPGEITVGPSTRATLVLPAEEYAGPPVSLQRRRDGSVLLRVDAAADLVLAAGEQPMDAQALLRAGHARAMGKDLELTLGLGARGRVKLGPYTVLLQVVMGQMAVTVPPRRSPVQQVARLIGTDRTWAASLLGAVLFVGLIVGQALYQYRLIDRFLVPAQPEEMHVGPIEVELPTPPEPDKPTPVAQVEPTPLQPAKTAPTTAPVRQPVVEKSVAKRAEVDVEPRKTVREVVVQNTIVGVFDKLQGTSGMFAPDDKGDVIARQAFAHGPTGETEAQGPGTSALILEHSRVERAREAMATARTSLGPREADVAKPTAKPREIDVKPVLHGEDPDLPADESAAVARVMARKNAGVRHCYETALREDADLGGKVAIRFVVGAAGTVTETEVRGASGSFAGCIRAIFDNVRGLPQFSTPRAFHQTYVFSKGG